MKANAIFLDELEHNHLLAIEFQYPILASNKQTFNMESERAFTRFTKLLIKPTRTSFFQTSNELEHFYPSLQMEV